VKNLLDFKNKLHMSSYGNLHSYSYLACAYLKFLAFGRALNFPLVLHVQTQSFCNARCSVCPYPVMSKKFPQGTMEWDLFIKITNEAASEPMLSTFACTLQNEPLLDKRIFDCVRHFKGINRYKKTKIVTNGELLDRYSLSDIIQSDLDCLTVSLNAQSRDVYMKVNEGLDYDRVMRNISSLLSDKNTKRKLTLNFLNTKINSHEVCGAVLDWRKQGIKTRLVEMSNRAGSLEGYESLRLGKRYYGRNTLSRLRSRLIYSLGRLVGCSLPFHQMAILFNGDVIVCCQDWSRGTVVGNVCNSSMKEIWNSAKMNQIRQSILWKRYNEVKSCQACSLAKPYEIT